jgi:hypothetical protein
MGDILPDRVWNQSKKDLVPDGRFFIIAMLNPLMDNPPARRRFVTRTRTSRGRFT